MRKYVGKEGHQNGEFNVMRLSEELKEFEIKLFEIDPDTREIYLTFEDELEMQVDAICVAHIPEPLQLLPNEIKLLTEKINSLEIQNEMLDGALNEMLFTILPELQQNSKE